MPSYTVRLAIMAWPIPVISVSSISCANLVWSADGARYATLIAKATFQLVHEKPAALTSASDIVASDRARGGVESDEASELAPYLPGVSVLVRGYACTPDAKPMTALRLRLGLYQDRWLINKMAYAYGDRGPGDAAPAPFTRLPLVWERAYGGPTIDANPKGVGAIPGGASLPNFVDASVPTHPIGFGPIPNSWPSRTRFLHGRPPPDAPEPELVKHFDFRYFHPAPPDQQLPAFPTHAWVYLEGMHPQYPWIRSALPQVKAQARLHRMQGTQIGAGTPLNLIPDMLIIHTEQLQCSIVWRGNCPLTPDDIKERLLFVAGLEIPGQSIPWPTQETLQIAAKGLLRAAPVDATKAIDEHHHRQLQQQPIAPFAIAAPTDRISTLPSPQGASDTPWGAPTGRLAIPPSSDFDRTIAASPAAVPIPAKRDVGSQTIDARSLGARPEGPALPFMYTPPAKSTTRVPDDAPSALPFGQAPLAPPPKPSADIGASTLIAEPRHAPPMAPLPAPPPPPPPPVETPSLAPAGFREPEPEPPPPPPPPPIAPPPLTTPAESPAEPQGLAAIIAEKLLKKEPLGNLALSGQDLSDIDFRGAILDHINFSKSTLARCRFDKSSLIGADLSGADLSSASFAEANLDKADLSNTLLNQAHFEQATLREAKLTFSKAEGAYFDGAVLEAADLKTARWLDSQLIQANLSKAIGGKADFSRSRLDGAKLDDAIFRGAKFKQAILAQASVPGADLRDADLSMANVFECDLSSAKTAGATLRGLDTGPPPPHNKVGE